MKAYQFKISIVDAHPPLWRRCIVPTRLSLEQLSEAIQVIMGWSGSHLSSFRLPASHRMIYMNDEWTGEASDEAMIGTLAEDLGSEKWFEYTYDFGDDWRHRIQIEAVLDDYDQDYPQVIKAKGDNPVEDCGGVYGLQELSGEERDPFDMTAVNAILKRAEFHQSVVPVPCLAGRESAQAPEEMSAELQKILQTPAFKRLPPKYKKNFWALLEAVMDRKPEDFNLDTEDFLADIDSESASLPDEESMYIKVLPYQLHEMLETSCKADLVELARHKGLRIKQSMRKANFVAELAQAMLNPETMRRYLLWLPAGEMYHLLTELKISDAEWMRPLINEEILKDYTMRVWYKIGYGGYNDFGRTVVTEDVAALLREILTEDFLQQYHQYWWLNQVIQISDVLYLLIPRDIFQQLLVEWNGFQLTEQEVLSAIEKRPADLTRIEVDQEYIVTEPVPMGMAAEPYLRHPGDAYFLPTEQQIWLNDVLTSQVKSLLKRANIQFMRDWDGSEDGGIMEMLTGCIPLVMANVPEREIRRQFREKYSEQPALDQLWKDVRSHLRQMAPYIRKITNHGFTDAEKTNQKQLARRERKVVQKNKHCTGDNVIFLDAHRRKQKNKRR